MTGRVHQNAVRNATSDRPAASRHPLVFAASLLMLGFLAFPVPIEQKAHAVMHGLCAQRPSHSIVIGGSYLPFDARMTGIYSGFLATMVILVAIGAHRSPGLPSIPASVVLLSLVGLMAWDGFNSLFVDLQLPHTHAPRNELRLITGVGTGVALGTIMVMLVAMSIWRRPDTSRRVMQTWWQPLAIFVPVLAITYLLTRGPAVVYPMFTVLLVVAGIVAFSALATVAIALLTGRDNTFGSFGELEPFAVRGLIAGLILVGLLAGGRFALESLLQLPPLV